MCLNPLLKALAYFPTAVDFFFLWAFEKDIMCRSVTKKGIMTGLQQVTEEPSAPVRCPKVIRIPK